jgi:Ca2+/H+ antiporter, TMEM165/GDT1 family
VHSAAVMGTVFALIALGELPDKSMFATLVLATRGRPVAVWAGAASALLLHVCFAVAAGGLLALLPRVVVDSIAAALFLAGAVYVVREGDAAERAGALRIVEAPTRHRALVTTFLVIFIAEWGDITQLLVANFAARYDEPVEVGVAAVLALWSVSALAVLASRWLQRLPMGIVRRASAAVMVALAAWSAFTASTVS